MHNSQLITWCGTLDTSKSVSNMVYILCHQFCTSRQLCWSIIGALQAAYLDVTALARKASATNARVTADVIHACPTIDTRRRLALVVLVFTVLAGEPCYTTEVPFSTLCTAVLSYNDTDLYVCKKKRYIITVQTQIYLCINQLYVSAMLRLD